MLRAPDAFLIEAAYDAVFANPDHEEHESMLVWVGGAFDPEGFGINGVNRELRRRRL